MIYTNQSDSRVLIDSIPVNSKDISTSLSEIPHPPESIGILLLKRNPHSNYKMYLQLELKSFIGKNVEILKCGVF